MPKCFKFQYEYIDEDGDEEDREYRCYLDTKQCEANVARGNRRCHNQSVMGLPFCYSHTTSKLKLLIKPSTRSVHDGKGVFAHNTVAEQGRVFQPDDEIVSLRGQKKTHAQMTRRYGDLTKTDIPYGIRISQNLWLDGACLRGIGMLINHAPTSRANCQLVAHNGRVAGTVRFTVIAIKNINHGTELLMDWSRFQPWHRTSQTTHRTYDCKFTRSWDSKYQDF